MLNKIVGISYGFSTRANGDMRDVYNRSEFLRLTGLNNNRLITSKQVHGSRVLIADEQMTDRSDEADGLVSFKNGEGRKNVAVGVIVADCVPLLFADKEGRGIGAAHAGWKGTKGNIAFQVVSAFEKQGIPARDILVFIGPHIGKCCYNVPEERAKGFSSSVEKRKEEWYLDLGRANVLQLLECGISQHNIELSLLCTSCLQGTYFSYRKDSKESYGEMIALIGFTKKYEYQSN